MTPTQLSYIRAWVASGNKPRVAALVPDSIVGHETSGVEDLLPEWAWEHLDKDEDTFCQLSPAALTIAKLADAFEQACEVTVSYYRAQDGALVDSGAKADYLAMRDNRDNLIGDGQ